MFSSKGLFSGVVCPFSETCVTPNCLFSHRKPDSVSSRGAGDPPVSGDNGDEERRKKRKLLTTEQTRMSMPEKEIISSIIRPVSPPPLRRQEDSSSKTPVKNSSLVTSPKSKTLQPAAKPIKAEPLNPRLLKKAPAAHDMRYKLLKALHEHFVRLNKELANDANSSGGCLILSDQELITMALDLEENTAKYKPSIYPNALKNKILVYKRMSTKEWKQEREKNHACQTVLNVNNDSVPPCQDPPKAIETGLSGKQELAFLTKLYAPVQNLTKYGYVTKVPTADDISDAKKGVEAAKGWEVCDRCKTRFQAFPGRREDGALTSGGPCTYHWAKPYRQDRPANEPKSKPGKKYRCCGQSVGDSPGCTQGASHVFKVTEGKRLASLLNFEETPINNTVPNRPVCIDGEMGYTVYGLELIRLTATAWPTGEGIFDVLVRPLGEVLDLNSRWSGVWPEQMTNAISWDGGEGNAQLDLGIDGKRFRIVDSPAAARTLLFKHVSSLTPIIGHGLENDLNAVRVVHPTIIDTVLLFPHKAGLPFRNSLKMLMQTHLGREIQVMVNGQADGHDSKEDANAAGELVRWAIGSRWTKMQRGGWRVEDDQFLAPETRQLVTTKSLGGRNDDGNAVDSTRACQKAEAAKSGKKRSLAEYAADGIEEGEVEDL